MTIEFIDYVIYTPAALSIFIFLASYVHDRRKIVNGLLFMIAFVFTMIALTYTAFAFERPMLTVFVLIIGLIFAFFSIFGGFIIAGASLWNARVLIQREGFKLSNALTLALGLGVVLAFFLPFINFDALFFKGANTIVRYGLFIFGYFGVQFIIFIMASFLYSLYRPRYNKDYVIVLGSGLIDGHIVSPLLQSRIQRAIQFYERQLQKTGKVATLIFSGGQGPDEQLSEAEAMQQFAVAQGVPLEHTRREDRSTTTYENMKFSKKIIEEETEGDYRALFSTNNYHVFRAGMYAKLAGLRAQGIGGKTALYYWPNAMLREFIAIIVMNKKWHLAFIISSAVLFIILSIINRQFVLLP